MITKQQLLQSGVQGSSVISRMSAGVQKGVFTYHFATYEISESDIPMIQQILQAAGWSANIQKVSVNEGDYTGSQWVDRVKVVLS